MPKRNLLAGGDGRDTILHTVGSNVAIAGFEGNDDIGVFASNVSVSCGADNDRINMPSYVQNVLIQYTEGDGRDVVTGFNETDSIKIGDGTDTFFAQYSGDDIVVRIGRGTITLRDAATLTALNIEGVYTQPNEEDDLLFLTEEDDDYTNSLEGKMIFALAGHDLINNTGNNVTIFGDAGGYEGDDTISGFTETDTLSVSEEFTTSTVGNDM